MKRRLLVIFAFLTCVLGVKAANLVARPGISQASLEWKYVTVNDGQTEQNSSTWQEWLTNDGNPIVPGESTNRKWMGDAETPWANPNLRWDAAQSNLVCAWAKEKGVNMSEIDNDSHPFPATIEQDNNGNHYFVVHGKDVTSGGYPWDNMFWIQSPKGWPAGTKVKVHFRYKASASALANTQIHGQHPSQYLFYNAIGDISFTTQWQVFDYVMTITDQMANGWSIAFNLNAQNLNAVDFYFDDLSWQTEADEGWFVAASNTQTGGVGYNYTEAIEFTDGVDAGGYPCLVATVGTPGNRSSWVNEVMISTVRSSEAAFKRNTIQVEGEIISDPDDWHDCVESENAKIQLPEVGVWKISFDPEYKIFNFIKIEGIGDLIPLDETPNRAEIIVHGPERDDLSDNSFNGSIREEEGGTGETWDNVLWIKANRPLVAGEKTIIKFRYKSSVDNAGVETQCHGEPDSYVYWGALGNLTFNTDWEDFETTFTVPNDADGMKSIAFFMAVIKQACDYHVTDVVWMTEDHLETLIATEGTSNFFVREGAGTTIHEFDASLVPVNETPNRAEIIVHGPERDDLSDYSGGSPREEEGGTGEIWDNMFWIKANRPLVAGEKTILKFRYKSSVDNAVTETQCHGEPGEYLHWDAIGGLTFNTDWDYFETTFTVPNNADGMKSIAFMMAIIKQACDYHITDVVWMTQDRSETLIDTEGTSNFFVKEGAGTTIHEFSALEPTDISQMDNVIYLEPQDVRTGSQSTLSFKMKNNVPIRGFQFDLYLPEGMTASVSSSGKIQASLVSSRLPEGDDHQLTTSIQADGAVRFLCNSQYYYENYAAGDDIVLTLKVNVSEDMEEGDYPIDLKKIKLSESNISNSYPTSLVRTKVTVSSYVPGDVNADGVVDISDYISVANYIHGYGTDEFIFKAGDVNGDGEIDITDYIGISNIIHTGSPFGDSQAGAKAAVFLPEDSQELNPE